MKIKSFSSISGNYFIAIYNTQQRRYKINTGNGAQKSSARAIGLLLGIPANAVSQRIKAA